MDPLEDDRTYVIQLDMDRLRARFKVATDEEVEDILNPLDRVDRAEFRIPSGCAWADVSWPSNPAR